MRVLLQALMDITVHRQHLLCILVQYLAIFGETYTPALTDQ